VRAFFRDLCLMWLTEYRLDGLRLDAVHEIRDPGSETHFLVELARAVRGRDWGRPIHLVTEDSRNDPALREPDADGGPLYTAEWNDDFHHSIQCILTDADRSYLQGFAEDPVGDLVKSLAEGYAETGQPRRGGTARGKPAGHLPPTAFVNHNQNHDQTGNQPGGLRLLATAEPEGVEVAHALLLASPYIPMLFMGEEVGETAPFHYFTDVSPELARLIRDGRKREFGWEGGDEGGLSGPQRPGDLRGLEALPRGGHAPRGPLARPDAAPPGPAPRAHRAAPQVGARGACRDAADGPGLRRGDVAVPRRRARPPRQPRDRPRRGARGALRPRPARRRARSLRLRREGGRRMTHPVATYRLQLREGVTFAEAARRLPHLRAWA
jgi:hypothetical protein